MSDQVDKFNAGGIPVPVAYRRIIGNPNISAHHAYQMVRDGRFPVPTYRVGRRVLVNARALERFLSGEIVESEKVPA